MSARASGRGTRAQSVRVRSAAVGAVALTVAVLTSLPAAVSAQAQYDLILRGGRVVDGSGNPWFRADVAVRGDRIVAVGDLHADLDNAINTLALAGITDSQGKWSGGAETATAEAHAKLKNATTEAEHNAAQ